MINKNLAIEKQNIINLFNQKKFVKISKISQKIRYLFEDQPDIYRIITINSKQFKQQYYILTHLTRLSKAINK